MVDRPLAGGCGRLIGWRVAGEGPKMGVGSAVLSGSFLLLESACQPHQTFSRLACLRSILTFAAHLAAHEPSFEQLIVLGEKSVAAQLHRHLDCFQKGSASGNKMTVIKRQSNSAWGLKLTRNRPCSHRWHSADCTAPSRQWSVHPKRLPCHFPSSSSHPSKPSP